MNLQAILCPLDFQKFIFGFKKEKNISQLVSWSLHILFLITKTIYRCKDVKLISPSTAQFHTKQEIRKWEINDTMYTSVYDLSANIVRVRRNPTIPADNSFPVIIYAYPVSKCHQPLSSRLFRLMDAGMPAIRVHHSRAVGAEKQI